MSDKNYPRLRGFLAGWFIEYDDGGDDAYGARNFARIEERDWVLSVLEEAEELLGSTDDIKGIITYEANRYFENAGEARDWLIRMCDAIREVLGDQQ